MELGITSIQRNRAPWIKEWIAFHMAVGFNRFYLYAHDCCDDTVNLLSKLSKYYPIILHEVPKETLRPQIVAYQHAWNIYGHRVDWMAFIDGDEFLFPTRSDNMESALASFASRPISAIGVHWVCYGSSGHLTEPNGLILENFTRHSTPDFDANQHVKSIVRGGELDITVGTSHLFQTPRGTFDDIGRPITSGRMIDREPSYQCFRINHYVTQSWQYFKHFKKHSGAADSSSLMVRPDEWFRAHDRNECDDGIRFRFLLAVRMKLHEIDELLSRPG